MKIKRSLIMICMMFALFTVACGISNSKNNQSGNPSLPETKPVQTRLYLDFAIEKESGWEGKVNILLDDQVLDVVPDSHYYTKLIDVQKGKHEIRFSMVEADSDDAIQELMIDSDTCLKGTLVLQDDSFFLKEVEITGSIADSAIKYKDLSGLGLPEALSQLKEKHFVSVKYVSQNEGETILDPSDWEVASQNINDGAIIDKAEPIALTCKKVFFQLYIDLGFDSNMFLARYDLDVYLDDLKIGTIPHGEGFTKLNRVKEGNHTIEFRNSSNDSIKSTKQFIVSNDSTFKAQLHTNDNNIEINKAETIASIEGASIEVPNVVGMVLEAAMNTMSAVGLSNVREEPYAEIWDRSNWTVISQNVEGGKIVDKNERIVLNCVKTTEYLASSYINLTASDAEIVAKQRGHSLQYYDYITSANISDVIVSMTPADKQLYVVKQVSIYSNAVSLMVIYSGNVEMPNLIGRNLQTALEEMKSKKFSAVEAITIDGTSITWGYYNWFVEKQSVEKGYLVNANGSISLTCTRAEDYLFTAYVNKSIKEAETVAEQNGNIIRFIDKLTNSDMSLTLDKMSDEERSLWKVVQAKSDRNNIYLSIAYCGNVEMPNLVGKPLNQALEEMHTLKFSAVESKANDGSVIWDNTDWIVESQNINPGSIVNANGLITLTVKKTVQEQKSSSSETVKYDLDKDLKVVRCERDRKFDTRYNISFTDGVNYYTFDECVNPRDMGKEFNAIGPLPDWFYVGATVHVKSRIIGGDLIPGQCIVTPATGEKSKESISSAQEKGGVEKSSIEKDICLESLNGKEVFEKILKGENVSNRDEAGDFEWNMYIADVNKVSIEVDSLGRNGKVLCVTVMDLQNTDRTEMFYKALKCVFSGDDLKKATSWIDNNLGKEAAIKIKDANIVLALTVSNRPIMYIIDDEHLDWI